MRSPRAPLLLVAIVIAAGSVGVPRETMASHDETEILPDLGMLAPSDFSIQNRPRGGRWLRFDTVVVNVGQGPFQAYGYDDGNGGDLAVVQEIWDGSSWLPHQTTAGMFYSGDGHDHFHVRELQRWTLVNEKADVLRGGAKIGFCFWDNYDYQATASAHYGSSTSACQERQDGTVPMGLSPGWGDLYPSTVAGQYIDITGLPNGDYTVTVVADPHGHFLEANENNNTNWATIRISRKGVTVLASGTGP